MTDEEKPKYILVELESNEDKTEVAIILRSHEPMDELDMIAAISKWIMGDLSEIETEPKDPSDTTH